MKTIQQHIDNLFQEVPETKEIKRIKIDLYLNAVDRYEELIALEKSESEALGTVIIEIGDREVLLEGLGYDPDKDLKEHSLNSLEEAKYFVDVNSWEANKIGLGILLILISSGLISTANTFNLVEIGVILLLVIVALAVGMFINSGLKLEEANNKFYDKNNTFYMTEADYSIVEEQFSLFKQRERYRIPLGVMLCIVSVIPILFFSFLNNEFLIERYGVILLMLAVGIGVFQFIKYGMTHSAFEKILSIGDYSVEERDFQQKIEPIAGIYWTFITLVYLLWSFLTANWHISWIIWPIAGVVWAIISMIIKLVKGRHTHYY